jgi:hypothetical protein
MISVDLARSAGGLGWTRPLASRGALADHIVASCQFFFFAVGASRTAPQRRLRRPGRGRPVKSRLPNQCSDRGPALPVASAGQWPTPGRNHDLKSRDSPGRSLMRPLTEPGHRRLGGPGPIWVRRRITDDCGQR